LKHAGRTGNALTVFCPLLRHNCSSAAAIISLRSLRAGNVLSD
jgi:hypothetical protein